MIYRRDFIKNVGLISISLSAFPSFLTSCGKTSLNKEHFDKKYAELIAYLFSIEVSKKKNSSFSLKNIDIVKALIEKFPKASERSERYINASNPYNTFDRDIAIISFYEKCKEFYTQDEVTRNSLMYKNIFESSAVPLAFAAGFISPAASAALSTVTFIGTKGASFITENHQKEILADPFYLNKMNQCVTARVLNYAVNDVGYKNTVIKIDPSTLGLDQEATVKADASNENGLLLDSFKNRGTETNDIKDKYLAKLNNNYEQINKTLREVEQAATDQVERDRKIAQYNYNLKEVQGTTIILSSFMRVLGDPSAADTVEKLSQGLSTLFTALSPAIAMGPFATAGMVVSAFSILSSMFGSSGPDVNTIIIKSLNEIRTTLRDIQVQLNRIEDNQVITYEAIVRLIDEFRSNSYTVQLSLKEIKEILLLQFDTEQDIQLRTKRQNLSDLKNTYIHLVENYKKSDGAWFGQYDTILTSILNYARNSNVLFTGSERAINHIDIIPVVIDKIGYLDLMINCLPQILRLNGLKIDFNESVCNPYEWSLATQAYIELRIENMDIKVPSDKIDITSLVTEGVKIRTLIKKTINKSTVENLRTRYCEKINPDRFSDILLKYQEIKKQKRQAVRTAVFNQIQETITDLKTFTSDHIYYEHEPIVKGVKSPGKDIILDMSKEQSLNIKPEKITSLMEYLANFIDQFEVTHSVKNYVMRITKYDLANPLLGLTEEDIHPDLSIPEADYGGHEASGEGYIVKNDPLNLCIKRGIIKIDQIDGQQRNILIYNRYKLTEVKTNKEIFPGSFLYQASLGPRGGEEWYSRMFHVNTNPFITYGLVCNPKNLLDYCHDLLCEDYMQNLKTKFIGELSDAITKDTVWIQNSVNLFYTFKLIANYSMWRKTGYESLPMDRTNENGFKSTPIILESEKMFHFNNIPTLSTIDSLIKIIESQMTIPATTDRTSVITYSNNPFSTPKGIYKLDLLAMIADILTNNLKLLLDFCGSLPNTKTLPVVDHTLLNLLTLTSMKKIEVKKFEEIV